MTGLPNKSPSLSKSEYVDLNNEADPMALALATRTGDVLESQSLFEDTHLADEVHKKV